MKSDTGSQATTTAVNVSLIYKALCPSNSFDFAQSYRGLGQIFFLRMIEAFDLTAAFTFYTATQMDGVHIIGPPAK